MPNSNPDNTSMQILSNQEQLDAQQAAIRDMVNELTNHLVIEVERLRSALQAKEAQLTFLKERFDQLVLSDKFTGQIQTRS